MNPEGRAEEKGLVRAKASQKNEAILIEMQDLKPFTTIALAEALSLYQRLALLGFEVDDEEMQAIALELSERGVEI